MEQYGALLTAYAQGDAARSVDSLLGLGRPLLDRALMSINKRGPDLHGLWDAPRYALAVMLHTDAGLQVAVTPTAPTHTTSSRSRQTCCNWASGAHPNRCGPSRNDGTSRCRACCATVAERTPSAQQKRCSSLGGTVWTPSPRSSSTADCWRSRSQRSSPCRGPTSCLRGVKGTAALSGAIVDRRRAWLGDASTWLGRAGAAGARQRRRDSCTSDECRRSCSTTPRRWRHCAQCSRERRRTTSPISLRSSSAPCTIGRTGSTTRLRRTAQPSSECRRATPRGSDLPTCCADPATSTTPAGCSRPSSPSDPTGHTSRCGGTSSNHRERPIGAWRH